MADFRAELGRFVESNQVPDLWAYLMVSPDAPDTAVEERLRERRRWAEAHTADTLYAMDAVFLLVHETDIRRELARTRVAARRRGRAGQPAPGAPSVPMAAPPPGRVAMAPDAPASASTSEFDDEPPTKVDYGSVTPAAAGPTRLGPSVVEEAIEGEEYPWITEEITAVGGPPAPVRVVAPTSPVVPVRGRASGVPRSPAPTPAAPVRVQVAAPVAAPVRVHVARPVVAPAPGSPPRVVAAVTPRAATAVPPPPPAMAPVPFVPPPLVPTALHEDPPGDGLPEEVAPVRAGTPREYAPVSREVWSAASGVPSPYPAAGPSDAAPGAPALARPSTSTNPRSPPPRLPPGGPFRPTHEEIPGVTVTPPVSPVGATRPWVPAPEFSGPSPVRSSPGSAGPVARVTLPSQARQRLPLSPWAVIGRLGLAGVSLVVGGVLLYATFHVKPPGFGGVPMDAPEESAEP